MGFSGNVSRKIKNRHSWRFLRFGLCSLCFYVNLPLLHRREAGVAVVKEKVKAKQGHGFTSVSVSQKPDGAINPSLWQAGLPK